MDLLADVLEAADPDRLAEFVAKVPTVTRVVLVSPHGFFAQAGVLGKPDTGGQVVYILDQARALEAEMKVRRGGGRGGKEKIKRSITHTLPFFVPHSPGSPPPGSHTSPPASSS